VISLIDQFASGLPESGAPCSSADIAFWKDVFFVLLPPPESDEVSSEQEG
jgi:hypothetical protein